MMRQSILEATLELSDPDNLIGVYAKGSSLKEWESPIDYVPELSDVDVQILLEDDRPFEDLQMALKFQQSVESRFL